MEFFNTITLLLCFYCLNKDFNVTNEHFTYRSKAYLAFCKKTLHPRFNTSKEDETKLKECYKVYHNNSNLIQLFDLYEEIFNITNNNSITTNNNNNTNFMNTTSMVNLNTNSMSNDHSEYERDLKPTFSTTVPNNVRRKDDLKNIVSDLFVSEHYFYYLFTIFLIFLYIITIFLSIIGNTLVLIVMCCGFRSSFLDISTYLMNLSIFNLLMSIFCIPFTFINALLGQWIFNSFMCPFTNFVQLLSVNGCIFTLTFLAINRFFAVAYPLKYNSSKTKNHNRKSLILIWLMSIGLASIQLFIYKCVDTNNSSASNLKSMNMTDTKISDSSVKENNYVCKEIWDSNESTSAKYYLAYTIWIFMETFLIPVIILIIMYSKIISILWKRNCNQNPYLQENAQNQQKEQQEYMRTKTHKVYFFKDFQ